MKLRSSGKLRHVIRSQMFSCVCSDAVLSPNSISPAMQEQMMVGKAAASTVLLPSDEKENRNLANPQFQRVPSSTQWEFALKIHNRSVKNRLVHSSVTKPEEDSEPREEPEAVISSDSRIGSVMEKLMQPGTSSKISAANLIVKLSEDTSFESSQVLEAVLELLHDPDAKVVKSAIKCLLALCLWKENRAPVVKWGTVTLLLEMVRDYLANPRIVLVENKALVKSNGNVTMERCLAILELLSTSPEGKEKLEEQAADAIPCLLNLILRVSDRGTEYAAGILCSICTADDTDMLEMAVRSKASTSLLLLMQSRCTERARRKALKLLKILHSYTEKKANIVRV